MKRAIILLLILFSIKSFAAYITHTPPPSSKPMMLISTEGVSDTIEIKAYPNDTIWIKQPDGSYLYFDRNDRYSTGNYHTSIASNSKIKIYGNVRSLYIQANKKVVGFDCSENDALEILSCVNNKLTQLNFTANPSLKLVSLYDNDITQISFAQNSQLSSLRLDDNPINQVDLSTLTRLQSLSLKNCLLQSLDISYNLLLSTLNVTNNQLSQLDLSMHDKLNYVICKQNQLHTFNVANGSNSSIAGLDVSQNNLSCIQVDRIPSSSMWVKDPTAYWHVGPCNVNTELEFDQIESLSYRVEDSQLIFENVTKAYKIRIYDSLGKLCVYQTIEEDCSFSLNHGIYILKTQKTHYKIVVP